MKLDDVFNGNVPVQRHSAVASCVSVMLTFLFLIATYLVVAGLITMSVTEILADGISFWPVVRLVIALAVISTWFRPTKSPTNR